MKLRYALVFLVCGLLIIGCSSKENLLDSYTKKKRESVANGGTTAETPVASDSDNGKPSVSESAPGVFVGTPISDEAFRNAAKSGDGPTVTAAIDAGVDVNSPDVDGRTALMWAAFDGHTEIVKLLVNRKSQINRVDAMDRTALIYAASGKNSDTVAVLLDAGAKVDMVDNQENWTALMFAAAEGNMEVAKLLLKHGANPTLADVDGETSVQFAASKGHTQMVKLLEEAISARSKP